MFTRRRFIVLTSSVLLGTHLAGCATEEGNRPPGAEPAASPTGASPAIEPDAYPVTITHKFGTTTIDKPPTRVVTAGLKEQDDCLALGVVPVASTTWFDLGGSKIIGPWAKEALGDRPEPTVLTWTDRLEFEKIAASAPDLILASYAGLSQADYDKLSALAPTVAQPKEYGDYGVPWDVQAATVGEALGRPGAMAELIERAKQVIVDAATANPALAGASAVAATPYEGIFVYGAQDPRSRLLTDLGLVLPADLMREVGDEFGASISVERVDLLDTDVAVWFVEDGGRETVEDNKVYASLPVHREGRDVFLAAGDLLYEAYTFPTVLSIAYLVERLAPKLAAAVDGNPTTN